MASGPTESEGKGVRQATNSEINMVPMIDLMVCCISFLLITAVWSHMARIDSNALVPGEPGMPPAPPDRTLYVDARADGQFTLTWKQGSTVISTFDVAKGSDPSAGVQPRYGDLGTRIREEWRTNGSHRDPSDRRFDQAVLHTGDKLPFGDIVAIIDAIHAAKRQAGALPEVPAFNVVFAVN
jgi:biopolymer transport protein ExbD